jgi:hypothetical protein
MAKTAVISAQRIRKKISAALAELGKKRQQSKLEHLSKKSVLLILGCQRSGTTMMTRIFDNDLRAKVYGEFSKLSSRDKTDKLRLDPLDSVKSALTKDKAPFIVLKPLVESQRAPELLAYFGAHFDHARALWMYRHYKDVVSSNLKRFGRDNGVHDVRPIAMGEPDNWRSEGASDAVRATVRRHFSETMSLYDAAALFWFARNSLLFDLDLHDHPEVMICKYEDLVANPRDMVERIYGFAQQAFPEEEIFAESHRESVGKGKSVELSPDIERLCEGLWQKIDAAYQERRPERCPDTAAPTDPATVR